MSRAKMAKILFIGGTKRGYLLLNELFSRGEIIIAVYGLIEDNHETLKYHMELERSCQERQVSVTMTKRITRENTKEITEVYQPDLIICVGWRTIIPSEVIHFPKYGCLGVHDSLLPKYRGFAPVNWCIINGETKTGVTLFHFSEGIDEGDIVDQHEIAIHPDWTAPELYERVIDESIKVVIENLDLLKEGRAPRKPQNHGEATYTCSRTPEDGLIDWHKPTTTIYNLIRGLAYPYPGAFTFYNGTRMHVWEARPIKSPPIYIGRIPGRVVRIDPEQVEVLTGDSVLGIKTVQLDGQEMQAAARAIKSIRSRLGH
jgi:methionyl-tRNA formyltransferase